MGHPPTTSAGARHIGGLSVCVLITFDAPIEAGEDHLPWTRAAPRPSEPPLPFTRVPGTLQAWQLRTSTWYGMCSFYWPVRGGYMDQKIDWFPAGRLEPAQGPEWLRLDGQIREAHRTAQVLNQPGRRRHE